jgi:PAS domain S-box-containing protein
MSASVQHQDYLQTAVAALRDAPNRPTWRSVLDGLPVPVYTTDADGLVTHWNRACADFAGREPQLGEDRWCVTWQLYTMAGEPLPHEDCPMAEAIKTRKAVRDKIAIALRPDGRRRAFTPYPTPVFDSSGNLAGAVNMLIDVTEAQSQALAEQAARCRRLARATNDARASGILADMARSYAATATTLRADP